MKITIKDIEDSLIEMFKRLEEPKREIIFLCTKDVREKIEELMKDEIRRMNCETNN